MPLWPALELTLSSRTQPFNMDIGQPTSFNLAPHKAGRSSATFSERNMVAELIWQTTDKIFHTLSGALPTAIGCSIVLTALSLFSSQRCNPDKRWWRNPGLFTDMCYFLVVPFIAPYVRMGLMVTGAALLAFTVTGQSVSEYFEQGGGPLSALSFWAQVPVYIIVSDFLLYWTHRMFHGHTMWRYHAIHHSAEDVDWTTAYRFHPVNLCFGTFLVTAIMLFLGISPTVVLFLVPFDSVTAFFVHANLNWTLGQLRFVVATPVFHRWHHTRPGEGGNANFAPLFSLWDVLFGTFYMPERSVPAIYGVDDPSFPQDFIGQVVYPFRHLIAFRGRRELTDPSPAPSSDVLPPRS
jgi:sterol desaturase/sphingolipid hydroxylase (fatty acid hydroxylase superfamily)